MTAHNYFINKETKEVFGESIDVEESMFNSADFVKCPAPPNGIDRVFDFDKGAWSTKTSTGAESNTLVSDSNLT